MAVDRALSFDVGEKTSIQALQDISAAGRIGSGRCVVDSARRGEEPARGAISSLSWLFRKLRV